MMNSNMDYVVFDEEKNINVEIETKSLGYEIVDALIAERKEIGMTQQNIADITGMDRGNIGRIESKRYTPTLDVLMRYANAVNKTLELKLVDKS